MNVYLDSIGCRLNQSEIERLGSHFRLAGHSLVATPEDSDLVVVNTCTVTAAAAADSRSRSRQAHRRQPQAAIVLTGCWSTLEPEAAASLPGVAHVVPNSHKDQLVPDLLGMSPQAFEHQSVERSPLPGNRWRTRAFIKVQDGCDNHCTFCIARVARGPSRSEKLSRVLDDIQAAIQGGAKEVVLTGVQLSGYGRSPAGSTNLATLVRAILRHTDVPRLRLSSLEPWGLTDELLELWADPRICPHLHLPLQSGCQVTSRRMGRRITPEAFAALVEQARAAIPDLCVTTDLMVGFPGESEDEFQQSLSFVDRMAFARAHVFIYSSRPGTPAAHLPGQVPIPLAQDRSRILRLRVERSAQAYRSQFLGRVVSVLWESSTDLTDGTVRLSGLTANYLRVYVLGSRDLVNQVSQVRLTGSDGDGVLAELVP